MRKTFLSICTAVFALLALSSCGKIWDEFGSVKTELDKINDRITALEEKLNSEVATINSAISAINATLKTVDADITALEALCTQLGVKDAELEKAFKDAYAALEAAYMKGDADINAEIDELTKQVIDDIAALNETDANLAEQAKNLVAEIRKEMTDLDAKIAITDITTNEKGEIVLTLKDGSKLTVSNVENSGLVTIVKDPETEELYWGLVQKDGTVESLEIPVGLEVEFIVSEDYELVVKFNGQEIYTGAYVTDSYYSVITSVEEDENYAIITIGDANYYLPKYVESTFVIKAGVTYFEAGETKEFKLAIEEVADFYVMTKPDGWKAKVVEGKLVVTAPVAENVYAEEEGEILLHGCGVDGRCKIAKLYVSVNENEDFIVKYIPSHEFTTEDGETYTDAAIYIYNNSLDAIYNQWMGTTSYSFKNFYFGFANIEAFSADPAAYIVNQIDDWYSEDISFIWYNMQFANQYIPEVEIDPWTGEEYPNENPYLVDEDYVSLREIYEEATYGDEMPDGSQFVIWWAPIDAEGQVLPDQAQYVFYEPVYATAEFVEATYNDIKINYTAVGDAQFYAGKYKNDPSDYYNYVDLEENLYYFQDNGQEMGVLIEKAQDEEVWLSEFAPYDNDEISKLLPNTEYAVYFFPMIEGKDRSSYTYEDDIEPYIYTFKTKPLVEGGAAKATAVLDEEKTTISSISVKVTPSEDAETVWYQFYSEEDLEAFENDSTLIADLCANGYVLPETNVAQTESYPSLAPETTRILVLLAVDKDGQYSEITEFECATDAVPYSDAISVVVESVTFDTENTKKVTVVYNVTGATALASYSSGLRGSYYTTETQLTNWMLNILKTGYQYYTFKSYDVVDGKVTIEYTNYSASNCYSTVFAYNLSEDKTVTSLSVPQADDITPEAEETPAE